MKKKMPQKGDVLSIEADHSFYGIPKFYRADRWLVLSVWYQPSGTDSYGDGVPGETMMRIKKLYRNCNFNPDGKEIELSYDYAYQVGVKEEEVQIVGKMQEHWSLI